MRSISISTEGEKIVCETSGESWPIRSNSKETKAANKRKIRVDTLRSGISIRLLDFPRHPRTVSRD